MYVHTFGAYFGLGVSLGGFTKPSRLNKREPEGDRYSNLIAAVGTIFLWMYWPSFNGALAEGDQQHRVFLNTVLAISGSCVGAAGYARILYGKLEMEIMLNATLAGGVAIGSTSDIILKPYGAMVIGLVGGIISAIGFSSLGPWLSEKINLQDTCGVHSLHGLPGVIGGTISIIAIAISDGKHGHDYFPNSEGQALA